MTSTPRHTAHLIPATHIPCYWFESNEDVSRHIAQIVANKFIRSDIWGQEALYE